MLYNLNGENDDHQSEYSCKNINLKFCKLPEVS